MNKVMNPSSIRAVAHAFRSELGVHDQLALDFRDILKKLNRVLPKTRVKVVFGESTSALAWTEVGADARAVLHVQESVAERLAHGDPHARYIIAHEIGHIVLNHQVGLSRATSHSGQRDWQRLEMEAALFASELLMPASLVRQFQTPDEVTSKFRAGDRAALDEVAELVSTDKLPLAPASRARTDVVDELMDCGYSESEISNLVVPKRTLARRRADNELLTVEETDKALRLSRIAKQATRVFGDPAKAHRWLRKPKRALIGDTPVAFLASEEGARKVEEMLHRIDYGMAA